MVTRRVADWLVGVAARRWSNHDEMLREWNAELHELAMRGQRRQMLRFAFSLAVSRPANPVIHGNPRLTAFTLLLAPVVAIALWMMSPIAHVVVSEDSPLLISLVGEWSFFMAETAGYLFMLAFAIGLALVSQLWAGFSPVRSPLLLAIAVILPTIPVLLLVIDLQGNMWRLDRAYPEFLTWPLGMILTLWVAGALARRGKAGMAWCAGILGAFLTAQVAIMTVMGHVTTPVDWSSSGLWLVSYFNYRSAMVNDVVAPTPEFYLMVTPYALAYVIGTAWRLRRNVPREIRA